MACYRDTNSLRSPQGMTVSYTNSPRFSALDTATPPQSPNVSGASFESTSPAIGSSSPRIASRALGAAASASASGLVDSFAEDTAILIPNNRMEAGLSLRRSPIVPTREFAPGAHSSAPVASHSFDHKALSDGLESIDVHYEPSFTGDIELHDRFVHRRPYVDRALSHSKRRSQLILEQKYHQQRSTLSSAGSAYDSDPSQATAIYSPRATRTKRAGTAPSRNPVSPQTPDSASSSSSFPTGRTSVTTPTGLRELTTGAAAQPASKRASWIRQSHQFEALSDSHHSHTAGLLQAAAPIAATTKASRRHSSFLTGDYRSASSMPILASNSFDLRSQQQQHSTSPSHSHASRPAIGPTRPASSKRASMQSTNSSATSSSKDGRTSVDNVEFEGDDARNQAQSSASSGCGHDETPALTTTKVVPRSGTDVFTTPRSSSENDKSGEATSDVPAEHGTVQVEKSANAPSNDAEPVPAPAIPSAVVHQIETTIVPPSPTAPGCPSHQGEGVSPTSSPTKVFRTLDGSDDSPPNLTLSRSQTSVDHQLGSSPASSFGTLALPANARSNGSARRLSATSRRDSCTSIASAASSTSTYRIRRKAVPSDPSDVDASERRESAASANYSSAVELSPQSSPAKAIAPLPSAKEDGIQTIRAARNPNGSDFMRMAQEAAQAHLLSKDATDGRAAETTGDTPSSIAKQPKASASSRDLSSKNNLGLGAPPSTATGGAGSSATRTPSRATIKRPITAPVGSAGQFRRASDAQNAVLEVEGQQFVLGNDEAPKVKIAADSSPSVPNAVRFMQQQRRGSKDATLANSARRGSHVSDMSASTSVYHSNQSDSTHPKTISNAGHEVTVSAAPSAAGGWGIDQELQIVDRARNAHGDAATKMSLDKSRNALGSAANADTNDTLLFDNAGEDESERVKAAAREAGIPEGSYAIHPPSMLQLFEASQCLVYNEDGEEVLFGDLFKKRRTLVCFLRHWWCGFCQQFAMSVRNIDPLPLKKAGLDFIIVGQGDWHVIKAYREVMQVQYPMFADTKRNVYRALGMTLRTNEANPACARPDYATMSMTKGILVAIKKGLFDMPIRNPGDMKLLGGDFILGPGLQCSFTHRMTTADGHMDIPRILAQAGCDMSLKTPKPMATLEEKEARSAMLAGGNQNRRQARSMGRSRGKKVNKIDMATMDSSFSSIAGSAAPGSMAAANRSTARFARPSLWGRFPGRYSRSQVSLPNSGSMADLSTDLSTARGFAVGPRSASAMRKISYDDRVRDSFETQQTDIEFESRATSFDTRGGRPSDVSSRGGLSGLYKAQSSTELRKKLEMGGGLGSFRSKPSATKLSLDNHLAVPSGGGKGSLGHSVSATSLRNAQATGTATLKQAEQNRSKPLPIVQKNAIATSNGKPAAQTAGLGIDASGDDAADEAKRASMGDDSVPAPLEKDAPSRTDLAGGAGSFLMDLEVYDSLSRQPAKEQNDKSKDNKAKLGVSGIFDGGLSPSQFSDSGFPQEAADAESDTEPSMSVAESPARSQRTTSSTHASPAAVVMAPSTSTSSFYSFNTFRAKPLEHLVEETDEEGDDLRSRTENGETDQEEEEDEDEDEDDEEDNDEPIEFEDGRSGGF